MENLTGGTPPVRYLPCVVPCKLYFADVHKSTLENNNVYRQRRCIVEHPFGTVKRSLGYSFFLRRKNENVDAEAASMFIAYNFKRLLSLFSTQELIKKFE